MAKKYKYRSAVTGFYVTEEFALENPDTTVKEAVESIEDSVQQDEEE